MGLRKKKSLVEQALDQANDYLDAARPHVESALGSAKDFVQDTALPALADAKDKAGPALAEARDKATPILVEARDKAAPIVASGATLAAEKATAARELADAKVAQIKGEEPKKKSRLKRFVLLAALAGAVAFVAKKLQGSQQSDNWQSSYTPTPAPTPSPAGDTDDTGGASPDEAIADAAEAPHPVSTPEEPAEVVEIDPETDRS